MATRKRCAMAAMHPVSGTAAAVLLLLPLIFMLQGNECPPQAPAAAPAAPAAAAPVAAAPAGRVSDPGVFAAQPGTRALTVSGDVDVVRGTLTVSDGDIVVNGHSLRNVLAAIVEQGRASCGGIPCVHGVHDFLRTCQCVCEAGWTGAACDAFDCFGRGDWNAALQRCDCDPPYERSTRCEFRMCRGVMATACEPLLSTGCDEDGVFPADGCTERCAAPGGCRYRLNWGRSRAPTADYMVGLCGVAFSADGAFTSFAAMQCASNLSSTECGAVFAREAPLCCLYGANCGRTICSSASCCAQRRQRTSCLDAGCAWASGRVCADPRLVNTSSDCELPPQFNLTGTWSTNVVGCNETVCPATAVDRYAAALRDVCGTQAPAGACLPALRARLDREAWPELMAGPLPSLTPFRLDVLLTNGSDSGRSVGACRGARLCSAARRDALVFTFVPGSPAGLLSAWQEQHASGFLIVQAGGQLSCVASSETPELLQMQMFSADGIYLVPAAAAQPACGVYVLPVNGTLRDERGERVATSDFVWGYDDDVLPLRISTW